MCVRLLRVHERENSKTKLTKRNKIRYVLFTPKEKYFHQILDQAVNRKSVRFGVNAITQKRIDLKGLSLVYGLYTKVVVPYKLFVQSGEAKVCL